MMGGCSSHAAMLDVSAAIPDNSFKTSTPFIDIAKPCSCIKPVAAKWTFVRVFHRAAVKQ